MLLYSIGYLLGKLIFAYIAVCLICFFLSKFQYKNAVALAHGKKGLVAISLFFAVPFITGLSSSLA
ncbi:hypothetical protein [Agarilytica rhodophyticola]|uniref:hypothetical protein n=1 Tax=Agarilytica rhodophyticola TaxID=1737490 RepID=UPI000B342CA1|nr:hypothetical protein [Agarilytica rhodophyticola]